MQYFLSCDWGTSSLRIRLVETGSGRILAERATNEGIATIFNEWQITGYLEGQKKDFYLTRLNKHVEALGEISGIATNDLKFVISGMASSSIGFIEVPYSYAPFPLDGTGIETALVQAGEKFGHDVLVIGGVRTANDVIRGEETQLIGCIRPGGFLKDGLFIFPGTHSKHIPVKDNRAVDFKTYMTGEVFNLLGSHSILKDSIMFPGDSTLSMPDFMRGVRETGKTNLLHAIFHVRTNQLFNLTGKIENYAYLSGLLIGAELQDLINLDYAGICLVANGAIAFYYHAALVELTPGKEIRLFTDQLAAEALVYGQLKIAGASNFLYE